ncbi:inositol monophosphatase family protein [Buchnera aphidicola]|uniref:inositol monophosphatase family protein n=1 Tax=Buchnera aphidicola TaxID=9 RepID=UPI00094D6A00|nr:inositol monophosphatase family protein [Buchnera aphidicola]
MNPLLNIAIRAIRKGGNLIAKNYDSINYNQYNNLDIDYNNNIINIMCKKIFNVIFNIIHDVYPKHVILDINHKKNINNNTDTQWWINTLDGKINFIHKIPYFCLSIMIKKNNITNFSIIYDPIKNDLFTATKGKGAQLNGCRMRCKKYTTFSKKIVVMHFNYINTKNLHLCMLITKTLLKEKIYIRNFGCSTLDLVYLAAGKIDAYINLKYIHQKNIAGELQTRESGALITDIFGNCNYIKNNNILIGNAKTLEFILKKIYFLKNLINLNKK